jgi:hypothetical protein
MNEKRLLTASDLQAGTISNVDLGLATSASFAPANPTGTTSTTGVMMGLGSTIAYTPNKTGKIKITLASTGVNSTAGDGFSAKLAYGTGTAPANGAALSGTAVGNTVAVSAGTVAEGFALIALVSGLTVNTAIWIDIQLAAVTGGTASISNIVCVVEELVA